MGVLTMRMLDVPQGLDVVHDHKRKMLDVGEVLGACLMWMTCYDHDDNDQVRFVARAGCSS